MGSLKYVDEAAALAKHGDEAMDAAKSLRRTATAADAVADTAKQADELVDSGDGIKYNGAKFSNQEVREWYVANVAAISDHIDDSLPLEDQARLAFEARNSLRTQAREMMLDTETMAMLNEKRPNRSFEELLEDKMERKGMSREEALLDIYKTATKTNEKVNNLFGLGG